MSAFTMTLKRAIELTGGTIEIGEDGISRFTPGDSGLGLTKYPIWTEDYRPILNGKIVDHYLNREIGMETIDLFQHAVRRLLNERMPIFNKLYASAQIDYDPLTTVDIKTINSTDSTQVSNNTGTNQTTSDSTNVSRSVASETPQTMLAADEDYATSAADSNGQSGATSTATEDSSNDVTTNLDGETTVKGWQGIAPELISAYRATLLNIDLMIIDELKECFMGIWDTGDSYTQSSANYYGGFYL